MEYSRKSEDFQKLKKLSRREEKYQVEELRDHTKVLGARRGFKLILLHWQAIKELKGGGGVMVL